jgi:hypothetical protein
MFFQHDGVSLPHCMHADCSRLEEIRTISLSLDLVGEGGSHGHHNPSFFVVTSGIPFIKPPVEPEEKLVARILSACGTVQYTPSLSGCARTCASL